MPSRNLHHAALKHTGSLHAAPMVAATPIGLPSELVVFGQGVIAVKLTDSKRDLKLTVSTRNQEGGKAALYSFVLGVTCGGMSFTSLADDRATELLKIDDENVGLDAEPACQYWFSIDSQNRKLRYGKGEIRLEAQCAEYTIPGPVGQRKEPNVWIFDLIDIGYENVTTATVWRDPLAVRLPLVVIPSDQITMDQAALSLAAVPANLSGECQKLYNNICGKSFELDTPEFPELSAAIEASIADPGGWCNQRLLAKAGEFGDADPKSTYLRITMGVNQGESPGIPYVLEIWPPNHNSPIHNHAGANAVIRVLHGAITVSLYNMLSIAHQKPFAEQTFGTGAVTWISPELNQTHKLHNANPDGSTCMTVQCYMYGFGSASHYEYFDYIDNSGKAIKQFDPDSDMDFIAFKALMKQEWTARKLSRTV